MVALFVDLSTGACRLDCGSPDCSALGAPWTHVLTFEALAELTGNRVTTSFGGVGPMESASAGDLIDDRLLVRVPAGVPTGVIFGGGERRVEFAFAFEAGEVPSLSVLQLNVTMDGP